jgi:hypothetical protein
MRVLSRVRPEQPTASTLSCAANEDTLESPPARAAKMAHNIPGYEVLDGHKFNNRPEDCLGFRQYREVIIKIAGCRLGGRACSRNGRFESELHRRMELPASCCKAHHRRKTGKQVHISSASSSSSLTAECQITHRQFRFVPAQVLRSSLEPACKGQRLSQAFGLEATRE